MEFLAGGLVLKNNGVLNLKHVAPPPFRPPRPRPPPARIPVSIHMYSRMDQDDDKSIYRKYVCLLDQLLGLFDARSILILLGIHYCFLLCSLTNLFFVNPAITIWRSTPLSKPFIIPEVTVARTLTPPSSLRLSLQDLMFLPSFLLPFSLLRDLQHKQNQLHN